MSISLLLEMAASSNPDRTAVVSGELRLTTSELSELADGGAGVIAASGAQHAAYVGTGGALLPLLLFSSARAEVRLYLLAAVLLASAITGTIAWEIVNPITTLHRGLLFGVTWGLLPVAAIFMLDVFVAPNAWCGHLCPVGAFYGLLNHRALTRISAPRRDACDDCMDCYAVCPEMHVISPALKGARTGASPVILSADCTTCGRCIDVCPERVFRFTHRFDNRLSPPAAATGAQTTAEAA